MRARRAARRSEARGAARSASAASTSSARCVIDRMSVRHARFAAFATAPRRACASAASNRAAPGVSSRPAATADAAARTASSAGARSSSSAMEARAPATRSSERARPPLARVLRVRHGQRVGDEAEIALKLVAVAIGAAELACAPEAPCGPAARCRAGRASAAPLALLLHELERGDEPGLDEAQLAPPRLALRLRALPAPRRRALRARPPRARRRARRAPSRACVDCESAPAELAHRREQPLSPRAR